MNSAFSHARKIWYSKSGRAAPPYNMMVVFMALEIARGMDPDKFAKVLALADSNHHGEAQSALRAARIMLARAGLTFRDLADRARQPEWTAPVQPAPSPPPAPVSPSTAPVATTGGDEVLRSQVRVMESRIRELEQTVERQQGELSRQRQETSRWHALARETAEKLWDVGKVLEGRAVQVKEADKRRTLIDMLRDPETADLSDREIARRTGIPVHAVAYWRRRLALVDRSRHATRVSQRDRRLLGSLGSRTDGIRGG